METHLFSVSGPPDSVEPIGASQYTNRVTEESATKAIPVPKVREPLAAVVRVKGGKGTLKLGPATYRIGAGGDSDLVIVDESVSRNHLEVSLAPEGVRIRDQGSRNGTYYLGQRVGDLTLSLGSDFQIGQTWLEVVADKDDFEGTQGEALDHYGELYGVSPPMKRLFTLLRRLEGSLVNVLIEGESGTGKELIARAIHKHSQVSSGPFVALNCGALDRSLVRSELFGHKKGAFTGAQSESAGAFAEAEGGTLFLDEVGELPLDIQPMLLRVLESGAYSRVGESKPRPAKVRIIAATHRTLKDDVKEGLFRADLYFRLMVVQLNAPPLRERLEDLPTLASQMAKHQGLPPVSMDVLKRLSSRSFPGNVRELKHALLAYAAVGELPDLDLDDEHKDQLDSALSLFIDTSRPYAEQKEALIERMTYLYLKNLMIESKDNRSEAARRAELQRGYLRRLLEKYGLA